MLTKKIIVSLVLIVSLYATGTKAIAEPLEIVLSPNIKVYAFEQVLNRWGDEQWFYFNDLIKRESGWNSEAQNPNSSAYGYAQFLNSTWGTVGCKKTSDKYKQIDCAIEYISLRYDTPKKAIAFHNKVGYY